MRDYILDFLKEQKPSHIYSEKEEHGQYCSRISRIWFTREGQVKMFSCYYNQLTILNERTGPNVLLLGSCDGSLFSQLSSRISTFDSLDDAPPLSAGNVKMLSGVFGMSLEMLENKIRIRGKESMFPCCELKRFGLVHTHLGVFSCLISVDGIVDNFTLFLGNVNRPIIHSDLDKTINFMEFLFGDCFEFEWGGY